MRGRKIGSLCNNYTNIVDPIDAVLYTQGQSAFSGARSLLIAAMIDTTARCLLFLATLRFLRLSTILLLGAACLTGVLPVGSVQADEFTVKAVVAEKQHDWLDACRCYDKSLRKDRNQPEVRDAYQRCLRRLYLVRRCQDRVYKEAVAKLTPSEALEVYDQVLVVVGSAYVDASKVDINSLFHQGLQELRYDFDEEVFLKEYLPGARSTAVVRFKKVLDGWGSHKVKSRTEAREQVLALIQAARQADLDVKALAVAVGLEFASGACNALDEYTLFLTPGYYNDVQAAAEALATDPRDLDVNLRLLLQASQPATFPEQAPSTDPRQT